MEPILAKHRVFDAVVAGNDQMAIGAIRSLKEHDIAIPADVAVIGFNGNTPASLITPALSTVSVPKQEMGTLAFELFQRRVAGDKTSRIQIQLDGTLVIRQSTDANAASEWELDW